MVQQDPNMGSGVSVLSLFEPTVEHARQHQDKVYSMCQLITTELWQFVGKQKVRINVAFSVEQIQTY